MTATTFPCVYICYDAEDKPLYIGSSRRMHARLISHTDSVFWPHVARIEILTNVSDYRDAVYLEMELIVKHQPPFNVAGVQDIYSESAATRADRQRLLHERGELCGVHNCRECRAVVAARIEARAVAS